MTRKAYGRISTEDQNEARQIEYFRSIEIEEEYIYLDKLSGKNTERPEFQRMLSELKKGDILYIESISRLARSTRDLLDTVQKLQEMGVELVSQKENFDTTTPQGVFAFTVFSALSELEHSVLLQRQMEGISIAKREGKYKGRKPIEYPKKFKETYKYWKDGVITARKAMELLELKKSTFYKFVKQFEEGKEKR